MRLLTALAIAALLLAMPAAALAQGEPRLRGSVTDEADALSPAEEAEVAAALERLRDESGVQLFVAFVDTTGDATVTEFTEATAEASSLGGNDALLLVAMADRSDALWVGPSLDGITDAEIDAILADVVEPLLAGGETAAAVIAGADAVGDAAVGAPVTPTPTKPPVSTPAPTGTPDEDEGSGAGGRFDLTPVVAVLLLAAGLLLLLWRVRWKPRSAGRTTQTAQETLNRDANRALLAADEALKDAANDVEFAATQWGEPEVAAYRGAIAAADAELRAAFEIRQRLDDAEPEAPSERDRMLREIVTRAEAARRLVDEQEERFDSLRDLERAAPEQLATLPATIDVLRGRLASSMAVMDRIVAAYAPSAVGSVAGNVVEAEKAIASADAETARGRELLETKRSDAVVALRRAQEAVARAGLLLDAVDRLAERLDDAATRLGPALETAAADVATARTALADPRTVPPAIPSPATSTQGATPTSPADPAAALAGAERLLAEARAAAEARPLDPLVALERATAANEAADAIIAGQREAQARQQQRFAQAASAVASARGHVDRAVDYITTRRHGVGRTARTRAAEAEAQLAEADRLAGTDPEAAIAAAQRAIQLADEAYRRAASEFDAWNAGGNPVAGPYAPPRSGGGDVVGAVIGGIIGGMLAGGGGPGWGGTPWGHRPAGGSGGGGFGRPTGPFGGGRSGGGSRGSRPSSGGGGGSRGGGASSAGGRVRGGRW